MTLHQWLTTLEEMYTRIFMAFMHLLGLIQPVDVAVARTTNDLNTQTLHTVQVMTHFLTNCG